MQAAADLFDAFDSVSNVHAPMRHGIEYAMHIVCALGTCTRPAVSEDTQHHEHAVRCTWCAMACALPASEAGTPRRYQQFTVTKTYSDEDDIRSTNATFNVHRAVAERH